MLMASFIDAWDVEWILGEVRDEAQGAAQAAIWADDVIHRRRAIGIVPEEGARLLPVLWEIARGGLTPQRARELLMKLAS